MRILVLPLEFPSPNHPRAGIFILRRVQALRAMGHEIAVVRIVPHAPPFGKTWEAYRAIPAAYDVDGIPVRTLRALFAPKDIAMEFLPLQVHHRLAREIARFKPDVVHASFLIPCGQIAVRQDVPTVVTAHGSDAYRWPHQRPGLMRAAREAIVNATRVTAVSNFIADCVRSIEKRDVEVIWNGGDERFFYPRDRAAARASFAIPADRFVVAFAGNVQRAKGVFDLVQAAAGLNGAAPILLMAGSGPHEQALHSAAADNNVNLRLLGELKPDRVAEMFAAADVVSLPSYNEGMPNVVCEAMLSARAVAASTVGGIPEIVQHDRTGWLFAPGDVEGLRQSLHRAMDTAARDRVAGAARRFAAEHLTWRISAQGYDRVLRQAASAS